MTIPAFLAAAFGIGVALYWLVAHVSAVLRWFIEIADAV